MQLHPLLIFCNWLASTSLSQTIQTVEWIIPATQTVHILAVATVITSALMIDLRLFGIRWQDQAVAGVIQRFAPFIWWSLSVLLATGSVLIVAEPARSLLNPVFLLKMAFLVLAVCVTLACQIPLRIDPLFWEVSHHRRRVARVVALISWPFWMGIVFAGRWIAYVQG